MNKELLNIELIDSYLQNKLSKEEMEVFNRKLAEDHEFERLFFEMEQLVAGIRFSASKTTVEEKLARLAHYLPVKDESRSKEKHNARFFNVIAESFNAFLNELSLKTAISVNHARLAVFSTVCILIFSIVLLFSLLRTPSPNVLFADNYQPPMYENF